MNINSIENAIKNKIDLTQLKIDKEKITKYILKLQYQIPINEYFLIYVKKSSYLYLITTSIEQKVVILNQIKANFHDKNQNFFTNDQENRILFQKLFNIDTMLKKYLYKSETKYSTYILTLNSGIFKQFILSGQKYLVTKEWLFYLNYNTTWYTYHNKSCNFIFMIN